MAAPVSSLHVDVVKAVIAVSSVPLLRGETTVFVATETPWAVDGSEDAAGVVPLLTYFLGRGVDPAAPDAKGCTSLHNAAAFGHNEAILLLLSRGIPVDPLFHNGTPLFLAAQNGHAQAEHGADVNN